LPAAGDGFQRESSDWIARHLDRYDAPLRRTCIRVILTMALLSQHVVLGQSPVFGPVPKGETWDFGVWTGEAFGVPLGSSSGTAQLTMAGLHAGRVIKRFSGDSGTNGVLEYTFEVQPLFLVTRPQTAYGGGISPVGLKWDLRRRSRYRPYFEWNGGGMFTQKNVPPGRTASFNFTTSLGPGLMIYTKPNQAISVGVRAWHLSNAHTGYTNPSFNTLELVIGYHWLRSTHYPRQEVATGRSRPNCLPHSCPN